MKEDFSGYATKANVVCSDNRTILPGAFKHDDGKKVPLVWHHLRDQPGNVIGHVILEHRDDGMYARGFFNNTPTANDARELLRHGDINAMSIHANQLKQKGYDVMHGVIREVSLVLAGANPEALIENVTLSHADGLIEEDETEAIIHIGEPLMITHSDDSNEEVEPIDDDIDHADDDETVQDVWDSMTDKQRALVSAMVADISENASENSSSAKHGDEDDESLEHSQEDNMARVFEPIEDNATTATLSHDDFKTITANAKKSGYTFRSAMEEFSLEHAGDYGVDNIDILFPDAKNVTPTPEVIGRRTEWVSRVLGATKHSPMSRIKSTAVDLTAEEARAKGYVKGNLKKDEVIKLLKRVTTPTTIYKKQKLDRDDIVDIVDLDVVSWLKAEMRLMLDEEIARAVLIGDGREADDEDHIDSEKIRPIAWDHDMYTHSVTIPSNTTPAALVEAILRSRKHYKGTGNPTLYTTDDVLTDMILDKDKVGRRLYATETELAAALRVKEIVVVEVMEDHPDLVGILVNLGDYTIGADKGGEINMFDDFDIDYNQEKYLIETRISGALTKPKSAVAIKRTTSTVVTPVPPTFDEATNTITIPSVTGIAYYDVTNIIADTKLNAGDVVITQTTDVEARALPGYSFAAGANTDWTFAFTESD